MDVPVGWLVAQLASADCEAPGAGVLAQDANGWSALAYVVAGAYVLVGVGRGRLRAVATVMAVALVAQGVGSVLYHGAIASGSSQRLHDAALLALGGYVAGWHVGAAAATAGLGADDDAPASRRAVAGAVLGAVAGVVLHLIAPSATTAVAGGLIATAAAGEAVARRRGAAAVWTPALLATAAVAAVLWVLGRGGSPLCDPASLVQGHAAWHAVSAILLVVWVDRTARRVAVPERAGWTHLATIPRRSTMAESTPTTRSRTLDVVVTFEEHDDHTDAHAALVLEGEKFAGFGRARRAPGDPDVPTVGDELALARAMHELATRLLEAAEKGVADFEGRDVDLHL